MIENNFDFKNPEYGKIFVDRFEKIQYLRKLSKTRPSTFPNLKAFYRKNIARFIIDWGTTIDPRSVNKGNSTLLPFILFPRQIQAINWQIYLLENELDGVFVKTREIGFTSQLAALDSSMCMLNEGFKAGITSYKSSYIDKIGSTDSILGKCRSFIENVPFEFSNNWDQGKNSKLMQISFNKSSSLIMGDGGNMPFRGSRYSWIHIDEHAAFEPSVASSMESSLVSATNTKIFGSTVRGSANEFAKKILAIRESQKEEEKDRLFEFPWTDDPRKNEEWYKREVEKIDNPVIKAQELDMDLDASADGILIPTEWVKASIDAHLKLNIQPSGSRWAALDLADEGIDKNAICGIYGFLVEYLEEWSGVGSNLFKTVEKAFEISDREGYEKIIFDSDGLGAGARGDAEEINKKRPKDCQLIFEPFRGSGAIIDPDKEVFPDKDTINSMQKSISRKNKDYYKNRKAQAYFDLRRRFENTYKAVVNGESFEEGSIISISSSSNLHLKLVREISQPVAIQTPEGKFMIDKKPNSTKSPNLADALMMAFAKGKELPYWANAKW